MFTLIACAFLAVFLLAFIGHFFLFILIAVALFAVAVAIFAYRKHLAYKAAVAEILTSAVSEGKTIDTTIVAQIKAL